MEGFIFQLELNFGISGFMETKEMGILMGEVLNLVGSVLLVFSAFSPIVFALGVHHLEIGLSKNL